MLQIEPPTPTFLPVTDALVAAAGNYWQNTDFYNTQFKVLKSRSLAEKVVERLKLKDQPPFQGSPDPAGIFVGYVSVEPIQDSRLVLVQVTHQDPAEAARWANALADAYIDQSLASRVESARRAYQWLQERLADTQRQMREAREKLFRMGETIGVGVQVDTASGATGQMVTKLNEDYIQAKTRRIQLEAALKQAEQMQQQGQALDTLPQVASDAMVLSLNAQLANLSIQLSTLKEKYREAHPQVQSLMANVRDIQQTRSKRAEQIVESMRADLAQQRKRESEVEAAIQAQRGQDTQTSRKGAELEAARKEADSSKQLYEVLLQKLNETDIAQSIRSNNATLVERAIAPRSPVRPDKRRFAMIGLILGAAAGVALVFGRELLDNTIKDPEDLERTLHLDLLAAIPRYDEGTAHLVTEAYQNLRTALIFARRELRGQVVLICGTAPQEGKTTTLVNMAKLLSSSGDRTVALDFDLRRAQLHARLGLSREPGLTNFFVEQDPLDRLLRPTRFPNLFALTAGPLPPNPPAILTRRNVPDLLDQLRREFDWILVDSPPLASVTDALLLARYADLVVFVVQHNTVDKRLVRRNAAALQRATPNLLGVVLNAVDVKAKSYYYYYHPEYRPEPSRKDSGDSSTPPPQA